MVVWFPGAQIWLGGVEEQRQAGEGEEGQRRHAADAQGQQAAQAGRAQGERRPWRDARGRQVPRVGRAQGAHAQGRLPARHASRGTGVRRLAITAAPRVRKNLFAFAEF